jgi:hypothetical protein
MKRVVGQVTSGEPISNGTKRKLTDIRHILLRLHKSLLDFERIGYERAHGQIENSYEFLNLVMHNPWFAWLRHLSELIVQIDEALDAREPTGESTAAALVEEARLLLVPTEAGGEFQQKYFVSVQQSPEVVLAHAEFAKLLGPARLSKEIH